MRKWRNLRRNSLNTGGHARAGEQFANVFHRKCARKNLQAELLNETLVIKNSGRESLIVRNELI